MSMSGRKPKRIMMMDKYGRVTLYRCAEDAGKAVGVKEHVIRARILDGKPLKGYTFDYELDRD